MNKFIGTTLLVTGTTIGAGMLALPLSVTLLGPLWGMIALLALWLFMAYASFATLEANIIQKEALPISALARKTLGRGAEIILITTALALFWTLLAAYFTGTSSLMGSFLHDIGYKTLHVDRIAGFAAILGILFLLKIEWIDAFNRLLVALMGISFLGMLFALFPFANIELLDCPPLMPLQSVSTWALTLPVFFSAFGFHGSIHTLAKYANLEAQLLKKAFFWGSALAFVTYGAWIFLSLSAFTQAYGWEAANDLGGDLGKFMASLKAVNPNPMLSTCTWIFSILAIATSALGVGLGLKDLFSEKIQAIIRLSFLRSLIATALTLMIPYFIATAYPQAFMEAIRFAAVCLSLIATVFPALILHKIRKTTATSISLFPGGLLGIIFLFIAGMIIICLEAYNLLY